MKSPKPKSKKRVVKAWAVIAKSDGWLLQVIPAYESNGRPALHKIGALKKVAWKLLPCTITYQFPTTKSK